MYVTLFNFCSALKVDIKAFWKTVFLTNLLFFWQLAIFLSALPVDNDATDEEGENGGDNDDKDSEQEVNTSYFQYLTEIDI